MDCSSRLVMGSTYPTVIVFCAFIVHVYGSKGCELNLVNADKLSPILFQNYTTHLELAIPRSGNVILNSKESIILACPGPKNYLTATDSSYSYAICIKKTTLQILRKNVDFDDLECKTRGQSKIKETRVRCANKTSSIREVGYQVTKDDWVPLIKVCYDSTIGVTFYSEHYLYGNEIKYSVKGQDRPSFSTEGLGTCIPATMAYTNEFQKFAFETLLNSKKLASRYITSTSYLARGHLAPNADFLLTDFRRATFYFINATPQWQAINGGNWSILEQMIRKVAEKYNRTFMILTGTYGVSALPDVKDTLRPLYLVSGYKLPVPQFIWKIVYDQDTQVGIALIVVNNPFLGNISKKDLLCDNICDRCGWSNARWSNVSRGFIYCCSLNTFLKAVPTAPRLKVKGILRGNL